MKLSGLKRNTIFGQRVLGVLRVEIYAEFGFSGFRANVYITIIAPDNPATQIRGAGKKRTGRRPGRAEGRPALIGNYTEILSVLV